MRRIELLSENPSTRPSPWAVRYLEFPLDAANRHAASQGSPFMHDRFKSEQPMHVHHSDDVQSEVVVLLGGTGGPQTAALPALRQTTQSLGSHSNSIVVVYFLSWAVIEFTRLATLIVFQNPRRNHCTPISDPTLLYPIFFGLSTKVFRHFLHTLHDPNKQCW